MNRISDSIPQAAAFLTLSLAAALFQKSRGYPLAGTIGVLCGSAANETFKSEPDVDRILRFALGFFIGSAFIAPLCSKLLSKRYALSIQEGLSLGSSALLELFLFYAYSIKRAENKRRLDGYRSRIDENQHRIDEIGLDEERDRNRLELQREIDEFRVKLTGMGHGL